MQQHKCLIMISYHHGNSYMVDQVLITISRSRLTFYKSSLIILQIVILLCLDHTFILSPHKVHSSRVLHCALLLGVFEDRSFRSKATVTL